MNRTTIIAAAVAALAIAGAAYLWKERQAEVPTPTAPPVAAAPEVPPTPTEPAIKHPIEALAQEAAAPKTPLPTLEQSDTQVRTVLVDWLGRDQVQAFLQLDDFIRHFVATVDNVGRSHAAPRLWPVTPTPGRFGVEQVGDGMIAAPGNAERYGAFVRFIETIDLKHGVALYAHAYPLFQKAYEELGYPGRYFNDRLVEVIDLLIATPVPAKPLELKLTEIKGPIPSTRPWVRYEFVDTSLEALPAGQKMMLRVGPTNQQRLRTKLIELRGHLTKAAPPR